jgi:hypothetical protein
MKNAVFWDVTVCGSCNNRRFGGTHRLHQQGDKNRRVRNNVSNRRTLRRNAMHFFVLFRRVRRLLVTANVAPSSPIFVTLTMVEIRSSETSVPTRATRRNISEDVILHSHRRENLKSYILYLVLVSPIIAIFPAQSNILDPSRYIFLAILLCSTTRSTWCIPTWLPIKPWTWRRHTAPKCRLTFTRLLSDVQGGKTSHDHRCKNVISYITDVIQYSSRRLSVTSCQDLSFFNKLPEYKF